MPIYILGVLLLIITLLIGTEVNGLKKWLSIGSFTISSLESASLLFIVAFVGFLEKHRGKGAFSIIKLIIQGAFSLVLLMLIPSTATACIIISAQFLISILINFNLFPLMGINMPFVSYSGTGYVINMALIGIVLSVWRRNNLISNKDNGLTIPSGKDIISYQDGKLIIDLKAWRQQ